MAKRKDFFLRFPGGKSKVITLSYDDGVEQDIRLIELIRDAGIKCTFNINANCFSPEGTVHPKGKISRRMTASQCLQVYTEDVCEVAVHGYNHTMLPNMDSASVVCEIIDDRRALEALFDRQIRGMAYPFGRTNDTVIDVLRLCGIYYSRTVVSTEKFDIPSTDRDWLKLPATCHHNNPKLMELCDQFLNRNDRLPPQMFYLWGHTYEFEQATNMEVYLAWKDFHALEVSADGTKIFNPTFRTVWISDVSRNIYEIKPGETITLK